MAITIKYEGNTKRAGKTYTGMAGLIQSQLHMLLDYRDDGRVPSEALLWDIKLYEYILAQPDPEKTAREYLDTRNAGGYPAPKKEIAAKLGWEI